MARKSEILKKGEKRSEKTKRKEMKIEIIKAG
jgi:hypothetical protein